MQPNEPNSRRNFLAQAGVVGAGLTTYSQSAQAKLFGAVNADVKIDPDEVLKKLMEGNNRFAMGKASLLTRRRPEDFAKLAEGQAPPAIIVGCADSRVAPELIFDQGVGDLFVVRAAGNLVSGAGPIIKGSIEFAVEVLGARLIMVLGHTACGAIESAIKFIDKDDALPGSINELVKLIRPAVRAAKGKPGDKLENVTRANVERCMSTIKTMGPIVPKYVQAKEVKVVGGVYDLKTGRVNLYS